MQRVSAETAAEAAATEPAAREGQELGGPSNGSSAGQEQKAGSTRERILDVALDLFIEKGYDRTSLREIAENLGVTKAALYYHFASKDDILMALHMRFHEFGRAALARIADHKIDIETWRSVLYDVLEQVIAQRKIFLMHERNQAALEKLHDADHDAQHDDLVAKLRQVLADSSIPLRDRVRMACSLGAVFAGLFLAGDSFEKVPNTELGALLREAIDDVLCVRSRARASRKG
jgi:AcrR family transcriptional regulator